MSDLATKLRELIKTADARAWESWYEKAAAFLRAHGEELLRMVEAEPVAWQPKIGVEPDAWATKDNCLGPSYGKVRYGKLPIQSFNPAQYTHEKLYREKAVLGLMKAAYYNGYTDREEELRGIAAPPINAAAPAAREARIAELEAALREAGRNMKLLMECEADERDCKVCLARIDALLGMTS